MKTICQDRRKHSQSAAASARGVSSVADNLDKLLGPKNLAELEKLEGQIKTKLASNEPIDTDYWEHLLKSLLVYKARAKLRNVSKSIMEARVGGLRKQQAAEADALRVRLEARLQAAGMNGKQSDGKESSGRQDDDRHPLDPEPLLRLRPEDKNLSSTSSQDFTTNLISDRRKVLSLGFVPGRKRQHQPTTTSLEPASKRPRTDPSLGLSENEELLTTEIPVTTNKSKWPSTHPPARKPQSFNRVLLGYEWNKYNQTHYDYDNPPPKVVQGYRFNIFYPDLVDVSRAPTYKIEREGGRRRGEVQAKAGEEDMCVIRFVAGAPYEDVAFRIVDREWDYSAKRERGFRSSFDKGTLSLWFMFKKVSLFDVDCGEGDFGDDVANMGCRYITGSRPSAGNTSLRGKPVFERNDPSRLIERLGMLVFPSAYAHCDFHDPRPSPPPATSSSSRQPARP